MLFESMSGDGGVEGREKGVGVYYGLYCMFGYVGWSWGSPVFKMVWWVYGGVFCTTI